MQTEESKMDPKGVPGSPTTQSGKQPEGGPSGSTSGASGDSSSGASSASGPGVTRAAKTEEEVTQSRNPAQTDAKGIPASPSTQGGPEPAAAK